jgi:site-specific recombinase XerD
MGEELRVSGGGERWRLVGDSSAPDLELCNDYLAYLADRNYSPASVRAYAFDLLHFTRWLRTEGLRFETVDTDALLRYLAACRTTRRSGQHDNVIPLASGRALGFAPSTINRRLAAISGLFSFLEMRDPSARNPVPRGPAARRSAVGERSGLLAHLGRPKARSKLSLREPRRLPRGLDRTETAALLASFRSERDRAIAGLMLFSGLRSAEVLGLEVTNVDVGRGWVRVVGKGDKERSVPLDPSSSPISSPSAPRRLRRRCSSWRRARIGASPSPRRGCAASFAITVSAPACQPAIPTPCGTPSAPRSPKRAWTFW